MFDQLVESSIARKKSRTLFYFVITAAVWITGLSGALVFGVLAYDAALPDPINLIKITGPPISSTSGPTQRPSKQSGTPAKGLVAQTKPPIGFEKMPIAPPTIPPGYDGPGLTGPSNGGGGNVHGGIPDGGPGIGGGDPAPRPVETRVEPTRPETVTEVRPPIRRSPGPIQGTAIHKVLAVYPRIAVTIRQTGQVVVEVVIDETGKVISARAVSGPVIFRRSAEDAARQWRWNPTRLGGMAVQVVGTITFNFTLDQ